jgi:hypothetical protein
MILVSVGAVGLTVFGPWVNGDFAIRDPKPWTGVARATGPIHIELFMPNKPSQQIRLFGLLIERGKERVHPSASEDLLRTIVERGEVTCYRQMMDGDVWLGVCLDKNAENIAQQLLRAGVAAVDPREFSQGREREYRAIEDEARSARSGLWATNAEFDIPKTDVHLAEVKYVQSLWITALCAALIAVGFLLFPEFQKLIPASAPVARSAATVAGYTLLAFYLTFSVAGAVSPALVQPWQPLLIGMMQTTLAVVAVTVTWLAKKRDSAADQKQSPNPADYDDELPAG